MVKMISGLDWTNQIGLGSVITWLFIFSSLVVAILTIRSKLYTEERARRIDAERRLHQSEQARKELETTIRVLRAMVKEETRV
jgi:hypothetical protein